jgi:hypothetical protein
MRRIFLFFLVLTACFLVWTTGAWAEGYGSPWMDGVLDACYDSLEASDPNTDGGGNENMDLLDLYVCNDHYYWYFYFTIDDDIGATNWGKYVVYVDTDGDSASGADSSDAWTRNVRGTMPHLPEYGMYSWVDQAPPYLPNHTQFWAYDDVAENWTMFGTLDRVGLSAGTPSSLEWQIARWRIGDPDSLWCEVWSTGGGNNDNARDTSNDPPDDWNGTPGDWSTMAYLSLSTLVHVATGTDTTKPRLEGAEATDWTHVEVSFSEPMDTSAFNPANYTIPGLSVTAAESTAVDNDKVLLTTSGQVFPTLYTLTVSSAVKDLNGNGMDPDYDETTFTGFAGVAQVTFTVIDTVDTIYAPGFKCKGSWSTDSLHVYDASWGGGFLYDMYDDGSNGDDTPDDHIWKRTLDLVADGGENTWEWGVTDTAGNWISGNWQFQVVDTTDQELFFTTQEQAEHDVPVVFSVDMSMVDTVKSPLIIVGSVSPLTWDFLPTNPDTLNDEGLNGDATAGDSIWSITVTFPKGSSEWVEYKYGNGAEDNDLPPFVNRIHITDDDNYGVGNPQIRPTDLFGYFLDVVPKPVDDLTATLSGGNAKSDSGDVHLEWSAVTLNLNDHPVWVDRYKVYRDTTSDEAGTTLIDSTTELFYLDSGVVGSTVRHYYYTVKAVSVTKESDQSNPVGEFDKDLGNAK